MSIFLDALGMHQQTKDQREMCWTKFVEEMAHGIFGWLSAR